MIEGGSEGGIIKGGQCPGGTARPPRLHVNSCPGC